MNQRLKEIMLAHGLHKNISADCQHRMEMLAELIVRECVSIVDDAERGGSNEIWDNAVKFIKRDLLEHFGVEE